MDPGGEKAGFGPDPADPAPLMPMPQQPPPLGYEAYPPAGAYPQGGMPPPQQQVVVQPVPQGQTVVIMSSPQVGPGVRDWINGICGCFNNCDVCILSYCCPCYVVGQNAEALGESFMVYAIASFFLPVIVQWFVRMKIRGRLNIVGSEVGDCCTVWWCTPCALAQERNEVLNAIEKGQITPNMVPQVIVRQ